MFGTFEWEREDDKIVYGLVDQPQFFNPLRHQVSHFYILHAFALKKTDLDHKIFDFPNLKTSFMASEYVSN